MMTHSKRWICGGVVITIGLLTINGWANGFRNPPEGANALGHVGGKLILTDDASAIAHNPANIAEMTNNQVVASLTILNTSADYKSPFGSASTDDPWKYLPNLFAVCPIEGTPYVAGIGVTTPYGQSTVWDKGGAFRYTAPNFAQMTVIDVNPTLATKINDQISIGVGLDVYWSSLEMQQVFPWSVMTGVPTIPDGEVRLKGDGEGVGGNAAITFKPAKGHTLALTYRSPVTIDYNGESTFSGMPMPVRAMGLSPQSRFDSSIEFPTVIAFGYGIELTKTVRVEADVEWINFSAYDNLKLDAGKNNSLLHQPVDPNPLAPLSVQQDWKDTWTFGLGADWDVSSAVTLRAGYIYLQSPVPEYTLAPSLPDVSRHVVSIGAGYHYQNHRLDVAYGLSLIPDRKVNQNQNPAFMGTYDSSSQIMSISYGYSF